MTDETTTGQMVVGTAFWILVPLLLGFLCGRWTAPEAQPTEPVPTRYAQCVVAAGEQCRLQAGPGASASAWADCITLVCGPELVRAEPTDG